MSGYRVALLTNMVTPYRVPFFKKLANKGSIKSLDILTCVDKEIDREWFVDVAGEYKVIKLWGITVNLKKASTSRRILHFRFGIFGYLLLSRPDLLIIGDASWTSYLASIACRLLSINYIVWNEITTSSRVSLSITARLRGMLFSGASRFIASCHGSKEFLIQNDISKESITIINNAVDNHFFTLKRSDLLPMRDIIRDDLGIHPDAFCILYVGQLISRKRILETLDWISLQSKDLLVHFLVVGSGPLEYTIRERASDLDFVNLTVTGFVDPGRLSEFYVASDALVLLSEDEPWGMVINEALLFDKLVIASENVGAAVEWEDKHNIIIVRNELEVVSSKLRVQKDQSPELAVFGPDEMADEFEEVISKCSS